jgi:hypothetical protein
MLSDKKGEKGRRETYVNSTVKLISLAIAANAQYSTVTPVGAFVLSFETRTTGTIAMAMAKLFLERL